MKYQCFLELVCVSGGEEQHFTCTEFCVEITWGCRAGARLCHLQVCSGRVLLSLVTAVWQWLCWSKWATVFRHHLQLHFCYCRDNSSFVLWPCARQGPAQGDTSALLCPAPGAGSGCNCQENSSLMHPHPEQTSFTGRSCLGGVWGSFYCCLGLSSSLCCAGLSVSV